MASDRHGHSVAGCSGGFGLIGLALVLGQACAGGQVNHGAQPSPELAIIERFRAEIPELMRKNDIPGLAIAVVDRETVLWAQGFGSTDRSGRVPVSARTPFSVQSTSKAVTATAILLAVQDGLLDLDAPIRRYVPELSVQSRFESDAAAKITLRHLLSHTAGFTHEAPVGNNYDPTSPSFAEHVRSISRTWLRYPVGQRYSYSNLGIDLAGYALERASGKPFPAYVSERLLGPLEMADSSFAPRFIKDRADRAIGHAKAFSEVPLEIPMIPAGGLYTSATDLARFLQLHLRRGRNVAQTLLREDVIAQMYRVPWPVDGQEEGYALGLGVRHRHGLLHFTHGGGGFGFLADLMWYPEPGLGIALLTNCSDHALQGSLAHRVHAPAAERLQPGSSRWLQRRRGPSPPRPASSEPTWAAP